MSNVFKSQRSKTLESLAAMDKRIESYEFEPEDENGAHLINLRSGWLSAWGQPFIREVSVREAVRQIENIITNDDEGPIEKNWCVVALTNTGGGWKTKDVVGPFKREHLAHGWASHQEYDNWTMFTVVPLYDPSVTKKEKNP